MENKIITIITAYQPCKFTKRTGTTVYHQQLTLQQTNSTSKVNPCKSFIKDLHEMDGTRPSAGRM
eukprot:11914985-Ditylum_brightwellii.AAC.1